MSNIWCLVVIALMTLSSAQAAATTVAAMDVDDLTKTAESIVIANVSEVESFIENERVFTRVTVVVKKTIKGDVHEKLVIKHLGGRTNELATYVPGMPHFEKGEDALLFLENKGETWVTVGLSMGKWKVVRDGEEWKAIAPRELGIRLVPVKSGEEKRLPESMDVSTLEEKVKQLNSKPTKH